MPVLQDTSCVFDITSSKCAADGSPIAVVHAGQPEKFSCVLRAKAWDGAPYSSDVHCKAFFSDGRPPQSFVIPFDAPYTLEVMSDTPRVVDVTLIDQTPGSTYYVIIPLQFSA